MLTSTLTVPPATAWPGFSEVSARNVAPSASKPRKSSGKPVPRNSSASNCAGHSSTGAVKYQTANATGSHASVSSTKRGSDSGAVSATTSYAAAAAGAAGGEASPPPLLGNVRTQISQTISTSSMISACQTYRCAHSNHCLSHWPR